MTDTKRDEVIVVGDRMASVTPDIFRPIARTWRNIDAQYYISQALAKNRKINLL